MNLKGAKISNLSQAFLEFAFCLDLKSVCYCPPFTNITNQIQKSGISIENVSNINNATCICEVYLCK